MTGASGGIGRDEAALTSLAEEAPGLEWLAADLTEPGEPERVAAWAGPVDVLVNNAGVGYEGPFASMPAERIGQLVAVNLTAPIRLARALLPGMVERRRGRIVNVGSIASHVPVRGETTYAATKWGLAGFTDSLRSEVSGTGVGVTLVSPGVVQTQFFERRGTPYGRSCPRPIPAEPVGRAIVRAVERERDDVFFPGWLALPARLRGTWPRLYRRLAARFE